MRFRLCQKDQRRQSAFCPHGVSSFLHLSGEFTPSVREGWGLNLLNFPAPDHIVEEGVEDTEESASHVPGM